MTDHHKCYGWPCLDHSKILPAMATSNQIIALELLAQRVPAPTEVDLFGALSVSVLIEGDIVAPLDEV